MHKICFSILITLLLHSNLNAQWITGRVTTRCSDYWSDGIGNVSITHRGRTTGWSNEVFTDSVGNFKMKIDTAYNYIWTHHPNFEVRAISVRNITSDTVINIVLRLDPIRIEPFLVDIFFEKRSCPRPLITWTDTITRGFWFMRRERVIHNITPGPSIPPEVRILRVEPTEHPGWSWGLNLISRITTHIYNELKTVNYPELALLAGIQGTVHTLLRISFLDGNVQHVQLVRGIYRGIDEEVLRIINSVPKLGEGEWRRYWTTLDRRDSPAVHRPAFLPVAIRFRLNRTIIPCGQDFSE